MYEKTDIGIVSIHTGIYSKLSVNYEKNTVVLPIVPRTLPEPHRTKTEPNRTKRTGLKANRTIFSELRPN